MKRVRLIFINLIILTATSLALRSIGVWFQVYLAKRIGAAGIGLIQLILSIYILAITFATSGIRLATTRLVAEEIGMNRHRGAKEAVKNCLKYSIAFSSVAALVLFFCSPYIGRHWLTDSRTVLSLRLLALTLPFLAMSSVYNGYFTAVRKVIKASTVMIVEQVMRIVFIALFLPPLLPKGLEYACAAVVLGSCAGEVFSFLCLFFLYQTDINAYKNKRSSGGLVRRMFQIAMPVAFSAYVTSTIRTVQHILVPYGLKKSGSSPEKALASYGLIHGMVFPVLMFPAAFLNAISELIIPELAECQACEYKNRLNYIVTRVFTLGVLSSVCVMSIFFRYSKELGIAIFSSLEAGNYIRILAPIIPVMYMDSIVDGMLKGINEQVSSMRYNIFESSLGAVLIYFLLPKYAIAGYLFTIFLTRTINFCLSLYRMIKVLKVNIDYNIIIKSVFCMINALILTNLFFHCLRNVLNININSLLVLILAAVLSYYVLLRLLNCITSDDITWFKSIFSKDSSM